MPIGLDKAAIVPERCPTGPSGRRAFEHLRRNAALFQGRKGPPPTGMSLILAAVRLENHSQRCAALLLKQDEQLLHVLSAGSKVHGIDTEPGLALEFCRRYPEFAALLDSLDHSG